MLIAQAQECSPSDAFRRLVDLSQSRNEKVAHIARCLVSDAVPSPASLSEDTD